MQKLISVAALLGALLVSATASGQTLRYPRLQLFNSSSSLPQRFKLNVVNGGCVDNPTDQRWDCTFGIGTLQSTYTNGAPGIQTIAQNATNLGINLQGYSGQLLPVFSTADHLGNQIVGTYESGATTLDLLAVGTGAPVQFWKRNLSPAANGAQQWTGLDCYSAQGWRTASGGASEDIDYCWQLQTVQGTSHPSGVIKLASQVAAGGFSTIFSVDTTGITGVFNLVATNATSSPVYETTLGSNLGSASSITPTKAMHHITGTATISTISTGSLPAGFVGCIDFIPDGAAAFTTGGNIAKASTLVVGVVNHTCFDGTSWYPSY